MDAGRVFRCEVAKVENERAQVPDVLLLLEVPEWDFAER
jgi:hypothetical protein